MDRRPRGVLGAVASVINKTSLDLQPSRGHMQGSSELRTALQRPWLVRVVRSFGYPFTPSVYPQPLYARGLGSQRAYLHFRGVAGCNRHEVSSLRLHWILELFHWILELFTGFWSFFTGFWGVFTGFWGFFLPNNATDLGLSVKI